MSEVLFYEAYLLPQKLIICPYFDHSDHRYYNDNQSNINAAFGKERNNNVISANSKRKLWYALMTLQALSTPKKAFNFTSGKPFNFLLNFITLTLPAINFDYSDLWLKRNVLNNFLINLKNKYDLKHYVMKYEAQKNGNLHIHITTNTYIHYEALNKLWNHCLNKTDLIEKYQRKFNNNNPNSTDIHSVMKLNSIYQEFLKYIQKEDTTRRKISGRLWSCSKSLEFNNRLHFTLTEELYNDYKYIQKRFLDQCFHSDYFDCYTFHNKYLFSKLPKSFITKFENHLELLKTL